MKILVIKKEGIICNCHGFGTQNGACASDGYGNGCLIDGGSGYGDNYYSLVGNGYGDGRNGGCSNYGDGISVE